MIVLALASLAGCRRDEVLTDADGHAYRVTQLAKKDLHYRIGANGWVRVAPYFQYRLEREDAEFLYVREYLAAPATPSPAMRPAASPEPAPAAAEPPALPAVDRVELKRFDDGLPQAGQWRNAFALADLDGDGHRDLVHGPPRKGGGPPRVFLHDGAGHWRFWAGAAFPAAAYDYGAVDVADFDGDGHLDLALAAHLKGISIVLGDGRGTFRPGNGPADFPSADGAPYTTRSLLARDWNGDGRPDLLTLGEGPARGGAGSFGWAVYLNEGNGRWRRHAPAASRAFGDALAAGDFDADGHLDLLTSALAMGDRDVVHYGGPNERTVAVDAIAPSALVFAVAAADFDGDGRADPAVGYISAQDGRWRSTTEVLLARADGMWQPVVLREMPSRAIVSALASGDVDGDGHADLAAADESGTVTIFLGDGAGGFAVEHTPELEPLGPGCRSYHLELADLNGDGRDEIVAAFASEASPMSGEPGCPSDGRISVWTPRLAR